MKLVTKNTLTYLFITLLVFLIGGFIFYSQLKNIIDEEATEELFHKKDEVIAFVNKTHKFPEPIGIGELISFAATPSPVTSTLKDTLMFFEAEGEILPYRQLIFNITLSGQNYRAIISKPMFESDDLIHAITTSFILLAILLIIVLLLSNFIISKKVLKPFFNSLDTLNNYDIEKHQVINLKKCGTTEFDQLNTAIHKMSTKISSDFNNLKAFAENASHELQTPLAIIKTKSELLLQGEELKNEQVKQLLDINQTASRAAKLNQTLLLLSKIENNQFPGKERINFSEIVGKKIKMYEELFSMKDIVITTFIQDTQVSLHPALADIIVSNLLSNAVKYTPTFGLIEVECSSKNLIVSNTGQPLKASPEQLFQRFYKENQEADSTGLGLALVKQVALINNHTISYTYDGGKHVFTYSF
ncbi:MAG: histidine kinase [Bacteroidetes bacterium]|nr:histidine kinase [Bacteroidota bacterium]